MYKLTFETRAWIVKQYLKGISPAKLALAQRIHRSAVYQIIATYKEYGFDGLVDPQTGRPERTLSPNAEIIIFDLRKRFGYGACRIEHLFKNKGFYISHRQIEKLLVRNGLVEPNFGKPKPRRWVRYELPNPNDLWHTDWSHDPFTGKQLGAYLDDKTRLITSHGIFSNANAENIILLLKAGVNAFGKLKAIMTDHGSTYYANKPNAKQENI